MNNTSLNSLYDFYKSRCELFHSEILFDNTITYGEAWNLASARAAYLRKQGVKKGDVIALLAANNPEWCITYMSITMMGAIVLPLDPNLPAKSYPDMLKAVKCKAAFVSDGYKKVLKQVKLYPVSFSKAVDYRLHFTPPRLSRDDVASYVFTSGTTGKSKIVMLSHANVFTTAIGMAEYENFKPGDINLCILPLFHVYALCANFTGPFACGGAFVFQPSLKGPDIIKSLADNPITVFPAAPALWELFMDSIVQKVKAESSLKFAVFSFFLNNAHVLRSIGLGFIVNKIFHPIHAMFGLSHRFFISGGAPLKSKYVKYYRNMGFTLVEGYGLTETTGPIAIPHYRANVPGSVGRPAVNNYVKLKNPNEEGIGEIWLKGDSVMLGYYKNPKANREAFDEERYFNTGDLGRLDRDGNIFITGRVKNVIVLSSGKNVYPEELESYYKQSDKIAEIAVFGIEDRGGEVPYAVVVPRRKDPNAFNTIKEEFRKLNQGLPDYKMVNSFAISLDTLPVNTTRKLLYNEIKKNLEAGAYQADESENAVPRAVLAAKSPVEEAVINTLRKRLKAGELYAAQTFRDFKIDSLGLVDLSVYLEEALSVSIDLGRLKSAETLQDVVNYIAGLGKTGGKSMDSYIFNSPIKVKFKRYFNPMHHVMIGLLKFISTRLWKVKVENSEALKCENCIIIANHESYLDMVWLSFAFPRSSRRNIFITGKKKMKLLNFLLPTLPVIWIDEDNTMDVLKFSADVLRSGKSLLIFPEGTRTPDGDIQPFKTGAAYLAKNLGVTVIPVTVNGAYEIWPRDKKLPRFHGGLTGSLTVGEPIDPSRYRSVDALNRAMQKAVSRGLDRK